MPDTGLGTFTLIILLNFTTTLRDRIMSPILWMKKLRLREMKEPAQGCTTSK